MACSCINCALSDLIEARYPDGVDAEDGTELLQGVAAVAGFVLARAGDGSAEAFRLLVAGEIVRHRERNAELSDRVH